MGMFSEENILNMECGFGFGIKFEMFLGWVYYRNEFKIA